MTHACCTRLKTPQPGQSSYRCFCTSGPTCNSCAKVPSSSSQTLPITARATAYTEGLKQNATKSPETTLTKTLLFWLKHKSRPYYSCRLMKNKRHSCRGHFNRFIHLPVQVIYPKNKHLQHILYFSLRTLRLICSLASWLEKADLARQLYSNWIERRQDHCVNSNTTNQDATYQTCS